MEQVNNIYQSILAGGSLAISFLFGGWSQLLSVLLMFVIVDYLTGFMASGFEGKLKSDVGLKGIARKVFIFAMVAIANMVDISLGDSNLFRDATIFFYLANELLSIIENGGRMGVKIPEPIKNAVEVLQGKSNGGVKNDSSKN